MKMIGDMPSQLGQIEAADAMMVDGKIVTREDYRALAAQVEALRRELCSASDWFSAYWPDLTLEQKERLQQMDKIAKTTPQQHLAEVKAQAGRAGFVAGYMLCNDYSPLIKHNYEGFADKYANQVRQGEVE